MMRWTAHAQQRSVVALYASAYMQVYGTVVTPLVYERLLDFIELAGETRIISIYCGIEYIPVQDKKKRMLWLLEQYGLADAIGVLVCRFIEDGHGVLLLDLLNYLVSWYEDVHGIVPIEIGIAHGVSDGTRGAIVAWAQRLIACDAVRTRWYYDSRLLAGIRLESARYVVEYSVRKQLYDVSAICKRGDVRWR